MFYRTSCNTKVKTYYFQCFFKSPITQGYFQDHYFLFKLHICSLDAGTGEGHHIALRNGPGFLLQKRGKTLAWLELCTGTHFAPTHRLLFVLSCNDFGNHAYVHNSRLPSYLPLRMCPSNPVVPGERDWCHHPGTEKT